MDTPFKALDCESGWNNGIIRICAAFHTFLYSYTNSQYHQSPGKVSQMSFCFLSQCSSYFLTTYQPTTTTTITHGKNRAKPSQTKANSKLDANNEQQHIEWARLKELDDYETCPYCCCHSATEAQYKLFRFLSMSFFAFYR